MMPHGVIRHEFNRRGYYIITVTSHKHHGVSNHSQLDCFFNSLHTLATKKTPELPITGPLCRESTSDWWIPWQRVSNAKSFSMSWRLADLWLSIIKSVNRVSIGSDNGMSLIRRQTIILTNVGLLSFGPLGTNFSEILMKIQKFSLKKNASENIVCEMAVILSRGRWVDVVVSTGARASADTTSINTISRQTGPTLSAWWRHQIHTFSALLAICRIKSSDAELLMFSLICARINGWVNNRETGDLRRHHAHYDVTVMGLIWIPIKCVDIVLLTECCSESINKRGHLKHISPWTKWPPFWQTTFLNEFSCTKMYEFLLKFHWNLDT